MYCAVTSVTSADHAPMQANRAAVRVRSSLFILIVCFNEVRGYGGTEVRGYGGTGYEGTGYAIANIRLYFERANFLQDFFCTQCPHGIEYGKNGDAYVGKDGHPHRGQTEGGEQQDGHLNPDGEADILAGNA